MRQERSAVPPCAQERPPTRRAHSRSLAARSMPCTTDEKGAPTRRACCRPASGQWWQSDGRRVAPLGQSPGRVAAPLGQSPGRTLQRLPSPGRTLASLQPLHHTTPPTTAQSAFAPCARGREEVVPCSAATSSTRRASKSGRARTRRVRSAGARCRGQLAAPPVSARSAPRATSSCCSLTGSTAKPWTTDT